MPFRIALPIELNNEPTNYSVTDDGIVINSDTGKCLKQRSNNSGYNVVDLYQNKKKKTLLVHRLVASAFMPNPKNLPTVNHINGNKLDNNIQNLEWASYSENNQHSYDMGLHKKQLGEECAASKYTESIVRSICSKLEAGLSALEVSKIMNIPKASIESIKCGNSWSHVSCDYNFPQLRYRMPEDIYNLIHQLNSEGKTIREICDALGWEYSSVYIKRITRAINR